MFTSITGISTNGSNSFSLPLLATSGLSNGVQINVESGNINIVTGANRSTFTKTYVILEYTKTTDTATT